MKKFILGAIAALAVGCAAEPIDIGATTEPGPALERAPVIDISPELAGPARDALAEWALVGAEPTQDLRIVVGALERPELAHAWPWEIVVDLEYAKSLGWIGEDELRRVLLHELGHVFLGQAFGGQDAWHYTGAEPSVMRPELAATSEHLGAPELRAWRSR